MILYSLHAERGEANENEECAARRVRCMRLREVNDTDRRVHLYPFCSILYLLTAKMWILLLLLIIVAAFHCNVSFYCNGFTTSSAAATSQKQYALQTSSDASLSKSALQVVLIHDNSMHTALSNFLPSSTIATPSPSSYSEWNTPSTNNNNNNDIITNWLKTSATVDIFSTQASPLLAIPDDATAEYEDTIIPVTPPTTASSTSSSSTTIIASSSKYRELTTDEISTLQLAFSTFYNSGSGNRQENVMKSYELFTNAIHIWESTEQSGDEIAGLFRVRGDVNMVRTVILYVCFDTIVVQ